MNHSLPALALAAGALLLTATAATAQAITTTLTPAQDTTLYEDAAGSLANGSGTTLFVGRAGASSGGGARRALLQFDVSSAVPANAVIVSAQLVMFVEQTSATAPTTTFVHRVTSPWLEGSVVAPGTGGGGGAAIAGESTWLHRDFPNVLWTNAGGDFEPTPSTTFAMPTAGLVTSDVSSAMIADVIAWQANPASNFGWLLKTDEAQVATARRLRSRETANTPPTLQISYLIPGRATPAGQGCPVGGSATQDFNLGISGSGVSGGSNVSFFLVNGPANSIGASIYSLGFAASGVQLFPECSAYLPGPLVPGNIWSTDASGSAADAFPVPLNAPGFVVSVQGVALDSASPIGFTLSNAGVMLTQ